MSIPILNFFHISFRFIFRDWNTEILHSHMGVGVQGLRGVGGLLDRVRHQKQNHAALKAHKTLGKGREG